MGKHFRNGPKGPGQKIDAIGLRGRVALSTMSQSSVAVVNALLAIIVLRIVTEHLGPYRYGQLRTVITFVTICSIITDLGLNGVTIRNLAKSPDKAQEIISDNLAARG